MINLIWFHIFQVARLSDEEEIDSGCCGMAGSFGYQKKNSEISYQIGELSVFPPIRKSHMNTVILTSGFSCKHQIEDFTGRKAFHWLEILQI